MVIRRTPTGDSRLTFLSPVGLAGGVNYRRRSQGTVAVAALLMYASHPRPPMSHRYLELLDALKGEYESIYQEVSMSKLHREDAEYKSISPDGRPRSNVAI